MRYDDRPFLGEIRMFAGEYAPRDWMICDGRSLAPGEHEELFQLLDYRFGKDGTRFRLPDFRSRIPVGAGDGKAYALGFAGGVERVELQSSHLPRHRHTVWATSAAADNHLPGPGRTFGVLSVDRIGYVADNMSTLPLVPLHADTLLDAGEVKRTHENLMPSLCVTFIIRVVGASPEAPGGTEP